MTIGFEWDLRKAASNLRRHGVSLEEAVGVFSDPLARIFDDEDHTINGQVGAIGAYFGQDVRGIVDRLLAEQLPDGGWNCEAANGSTRSSFNTTICVLEALLEYERAVGGSPEATGARLRGQEYLLDRRLFRRKSTGEVIERDRKGGAAWTRFAFPTWWHYDVLRGLEYLCRAASRPTSA